MSPSVPLLTVKLLFMWLAKKGYLQKSSSYYTRQILMLLVFEMPESARPGTLHVSTGG
jgi:hypothetical protein